MRTVNLAKSSCDFLWSEDAKVDLIGHHLCGTAERHFYKQVDTWWNQVVDYVMWQLLKTFTTITASRAIYKLMQKKDSNTAELNTISTWWVSASHTKM